MFLRPFAGFTRTIACQAPGSSAYISAVIAPSGVTVLRETTKQTNMRALSNSEQRGEADRARAILLTLEGRKAEEIAAVLGVHISTVRNWRGYFAHGGVAGLRRRPRPGPQAKIGPHAGAITAALLDEATR